MIKVRNMKIYVKDKYRMRENNLWSFKWVCSEQIHSAQKRSERTVKLQVKEGNRAKLLNG